MAGDALIETLSICEAAEVERTTPAIFVDVRREVVVARRLSEFWDRVSRGGEAPLSRQGGIFGFA